jgi:hypothetical protein
MFVLAKKEKERQKMEKERRLLESTQEEPEPEPEPEHPEQLEDTSEAGRETTEEDALPSLLPAATFTVVTTTTGTETVTFSPARRVRTPMPTPGRRERRIPTPMPTPTKDEDFMVTTPFATPEKKVATPMPTPVDKNKITPLSSPFFNRVFPSFMIDSIFG